MVQQQEQQCQQLRQGQEEQQQQQQQPLRAYKLVQQQPPAGATVEHSIVDQQRAASKRVGEAVPAGAEDGVEGGKGSVAANERAGVVAAWRGRKTAAAAAKAEAEARGLIGAAAAAAAATALCEVTRCGRSGARGKRFRSHEKVKGVSRGAGSVRTWRRYNLRSAGMSPGFSGIGTVALDGGVVIITFHDMP